jgi:hypothetical protein
MLAMRRTAAQPEAEITMGRVQFMVHGSSNDGLYGATIGGVVHTIARRYRPNIERVDSFEAGYIESIQVWIGSLPVVRIDTAG